MIKQMVKRTWKFGERNFFPIVMLCTGYIIGMAVGSISYR